MSNGCACGCEEKQAKLLAVIEKNKNVEGSLIHVPVSYTHLDVYKRQPCRFPKRTIISVQELS